MCPPPALRLFSNALAAHCLPTAGRRRSSSKLGKNADMKMVEGRFELPDLKDPFIQKNSFSLLSKTLRLPNSGMELDHQKSDPIKNLLYSTEPDKQMKLVEQAKAILNSGILLLDSNFQSKIISQEESTDVSNQTKAPRPALGHKRARFCLVPRKSQPVQQADPKAILDHLEDPQEYFAALERIELADKERKRLRREDVTEPMQPTTTRARRPGLNLGRKTTYKHLYPKFPNPVENAAPALAVHNEVEVPSLPDLVTKAVDQCGTSQESEAFDIEPSQSAAAGRVADMEKRIQSSLGELLVTCKNLDESQTLKLLQEHLDFKPLVLDKLNLPDLDKASKLGRKSLLEILQSPEDAASVEQPLEKPTDADKIVPENPVNVESSSHPGTSSLQVRSPESLVSALRGKISQIVAERDSLSVPVPANISSLRHSSPAECMDEERSPPPPCIDQATVGSSGRKSNLYPMQNDISKLSSSWKLRTTYEEITNTTSACTKDTSTTAKTMGLISIDNCNPTDSDKRPGLGSILSNALSEESNAAARNVHSTMQAEDSFCQIDIHTSDNSNGSVRERDFNRLENVFNSQGSMSPSERLLSGEGVSDTLQEKVSMAPEHGLTSETAPENGGLPDEPNTTTNSLRGDESMEKSDVLLEQVNKEAHLSSVASRKRLKAKAPARDRGKKASRNRFSLAGAGTSWDTGIRRSTRVKRKPLQWWKGERLLYGRIHDSLVTVIGAKYTASSEDCKERAFQVESFVSTDYADLVEQAARH